MDTNNIHNNNDADRQYAVTKILRLLDVLASRKEEHQELSQGEKVHQLGLKAAEAYNNGKFAEVKKCYDELLDILTQLPDNDDHKEARAFFLNQLAQTEHKLNLNDLAIRHLNDAIAIREQLPNTINNIYQKETCEDIRDEIQYEINKAKEPNTKSDEYILEALQNKSKNGKRLTEKDIANNFIFTNEKPNLEKDSSDFNFKLIVLLIIILSIVLLLTCC